MEPLGLVGEARERREPYRSLPLRVVAFLAAACFAAPGPAAGQGDSWRGSSSLLIPRRLLAAAAEGGKIYTFGGCGSPCFAPPLHTSTLEETRVEVFDGQSWTIKNRMPAIVFGAAAAAGDDHLIYLFGGYLTGDAAWQYTPGSDSWSRKANLPTPRFGLAAVALRGKIYVLGGSDGTSPSRALEVYNPLTNTWQTKAPMPTARVFLGAAAIGRKIYAVGGSPDCCGDAVTGVLEIYDTDADRWTTGAPLPVAQQVSAVAGVDGRVFTFGGFIPGAGVQGATFEYAPTTNTWTARAAMPLARDQAPAVVVDDKVHVLGGSVNCHCQALATHQSYTPNLPPLEADLEIVKGDGGVTVVSCGEPAGYMIEAINRGPDPVTGAAVRDLFPSKLEAAMWTCTASAGARCAAPAGSGSIDARVDLPVFGSVRYVVSGTIRSGTSGTIVNAASIDPPAGVLDRNLANNRSVDENSIVCTALLRITKTDDRDSVAPGDRPLYRIVVSNDSPTPVIVTVTDDLEASGLEAVRWCGGVGGAGCTPFKPGNLVDTVTVPAHGTITYQATGTVPSTCLDRIENRACVESPGQATLCATDIDRIEPKEADLSVVLTGPAVVRRGGQADYKVAIHNAGPCPATDVRLEFPSPSGFVPPIPGPGLCGNVFPCELEPIPAGGDVSVAASFEVADDAPCGAVPVSVHVASFSDPNDDNDSSGVVTRVECDLTITKTDGLDTAPPGATLLYTITVGNPNAAAVAVRVTDVFPTELRQVRWCPGALCVPNRPSELDDTTEVPAGGSAVYRVQAVVSCLFSGILANTAEASPVGDPALRVSATDETRIVPPPGVTGCCADIEGAFVVGQEITYIFVLWNGGPTNQFPEFEDVLPPGLTLVDATATRPNVMMLGNTASWSGPLLIGENVIIRVKAKIDMGTAGITICNQGIFKFDADGDGTNESIGATDDPSLPGTEDPCCMKVVAVDAIPVLSGAGIAALVLLLAGWALRGLRRRARE